MASIAFRGAVQPKIKLRECSRNRRTPTQIFPVRTTPRIRSMQSIRSNILQSPSRNQPISEQSTVSSINLDNWIFESASKIVQNLRKAPLLVQLQEDGIKIETAKKEDWKEMEMRWRDGEAPEGVMLVEEIVEEREEEFGIRVWGIVLQGKSWGSSRCYLMKTTSAGSGLGVVCHLFYITRVRNFRDSAMSQINRSWLVNPANKPNI